jgi:hypothetical protein
MGKRGLARRSQITNFIVIGVILLLAIALFLALKYRVLDKIGLPEATGGAAPVKTFVESCSKDLLKEAIIKIGMQGGYLTIPNIIKTDPNSFIAVDQASLIKVPLWYYKGYNRVPSVPRMEAEINDYVLQNLPACIQNFTVLSNQFSVSQGSIKIDTKIGDDGVNLILTYPLRITSLDKGTVTDMQGFKADVDVKLRKMHRLATEISENEDTKTFLENTTLDMMSIDPDVPMTDLTFQCGRMIWQRTDVEKEIKDLMKYNLPRVRVDNTDYIPFKTGTEINDELYERAHFLWHPTDNDYKDLKVLLTYEDGWPMNIRARPSDGRTLKSNSGKAGAILSFLCLNLYHFTYDVGYPVLTAIKDEDAFQGAGFTFNFGLPVTIRSNKADRQDYSINDYRSFTINQDYCDIKSLNKYTFNAYDDRTGYELNNINMSFQCVGFRCPLGGTTYESGAYQLTTEVPAQCSGGLILANGPGYIESQIEFDKTAKGIISVYLKPIRSFNYNFKLVDIDTGKEVTQDGKYSFAIAGEESAANHQFYRAYPYEKDDVSKLDLSKVDLLQEDSNYKVNGVAYQDGTLIGMFSHNWTYKFDDMQDSNNVTFIIPVGKKPANEIEKVALLEKASSLVYNQNLMPAFG